MFTYDKIKKQRKVMGSSTSFLLIGPGELIYIQLKRTEMYGGRTISLS